MARKAPRRIRKSARPVTGYFIPLGILLVGTLLFVALVAPGNLRPGGNSEATPGPLNAGDATVAGATRRPGDLLTFGHVAVFNAGSEVAVLESVSFEPPLPGNLRLVGIQVAPDPDREIHTVGVVDGYPPPEGEIGRLHPFRGAEVHPQSTAEGERGVPLIMGFRFEGGDVASFRYVLVDYRVGDREYRAKLDKTFIVCSEAAYPDGCPDRQDLYPGQ